MLELRRRLPATVSLPYKILTIKEPSAFADYIAYHSNASAVIITKMNNAEKKSDNSITSLPEARDNDHTAVCESTDEKSTRPPLLLASMEACHDSNCSRLLTQIATDADATVDNAGCKWHHADELVLHVVSFMSLTNILRNRRVNQRWQALCDQAIDANFPPKKQFIKRSVLANAVEEYCKYQPKSMEQIACKYGYPINKWDVSRVECFDWVFRDKKMFNENISSWDVSRAKSFRCMFEGTSSFNQDLSGWDTSTVTDMHGMFKDAKKFNQPLESWNTSRVANMSNMFRGAAAFNTICVTEMSRMFRQATSFNQCLLQWDTSCVRSMDQMFDEASSLDQDHIGSWNTSQVKQTCHMFQGPGAYYYASKSVKKSFSTDCVHGSGDMSPFSWRELAISRSEEILTLKEELRSVKHDGAIPILLLLAFDAGFLYASRMQSM